MKLEIDFYNKLVTEVHKQYFPFTKYLKDSKLGAKVCYTVECFSNGALSYFSLIAGLSIHCNDSIDNIHKLVSKYVLDFEGFEFKNEVTYHRNPTKGEIKFGHGAIHYKDFNIKDVVRIDTFGAIRLKKWFVCPNDKLRYYR